MHAARERHAHAQQVSGVDQEREPEGGALRQIEAIRAIQALPNVVIAIGNRIPLNGFDRWLGEIDRITHPTNVHWIHLKFMLVGPNLPESKSQCHARGHEAGLPDRTGRLDDAVLSIRPTRAAGWRVASISPGNGGRPAVVRVL